MKNRRSNNHGISRMWRLDLRDTTKSCLAHARSFNNKVTLTGAGPIPPYRGVSRTIWVEPGQRLTSEEDVNKTTLETSEEDVDKTSLETSEGYIKSSICTNVHQVVSGKLFNTCVPWYYNLPMAITNKMHIPFGIEWLWNYTQNEWALNYAQEWTLNYTRNEGTGFTQNEWIGNITQNEWIGNITQNEWIGNYALNITQNK